MSSHLGAAVDPRSWFVLHTKSRQEKALARDLAAIGVDHYLPLTVHTRTHGGRKAVVEEPLFPGYVFLLGTTDQAYQADRTKRVANLIRPHDQKQLEWELRNIRIALESSAVLDPYPRLVRGRRVEVTSGPFRGLQGVIEERGKEARLVLQVDVLGRGVSLEIDGSQVELLD